MAETRTLIGVDCDPACKAKTLVAEKYAERAEHLAGIEVHPKDSVDDCSIRPTENGYKELGKINIAYRGIELLSSVGRNCTQACGIERYTRSVIAGAPEDMQPFGSALTETINEILGE